MSTKLTNRGLHALYLTSSILFAGAISISMVSAAEGDSSGGTTGQDALAELQQAVNDVSELNAQPVPQAEETVAATPAPETAPAPAPVQEAPPQAHPPQPEPAAEDKTALPNLDDILKEPEAPSVPQITTTGDVPAPQPVVEAPAVVTPSEAPPAPAASPAVATQNPEPAPIPAVESPKGSLSFIDQTGKVFTLKGIDIPDGLTGWVFATDNVDAIKAQLSEIQQTQQAAAQQASQPTVPQGQGYAPAQGAPVNHGGYAQQGYEQQLQYAPQGGQFGGQAGYGPQMSYGAQGMQMGGMPMQQAYNRNQQQSFGPQQFGQQQMQPGGQQFSRYPGQQNMGSQPTMNNPQMMYQQQGQPMMQQYGIQQQSGRPGGFAMSQQGQGGAIHNPLAMGQQPAATPAGQGTQSSEAKKPVRFVCYLE